MTEAEYRHALIRAYERLKLEFNKSLVRTVGYMTTGCSDAAYREVRL